MLKENGFSPKDRDLLLEKINSGEIELKNAKWLTEHRAAKEWQNGFRERFGSTTALTFTNPDGIDVMDRGSFSGFPGIQYSDDVEQVLKKRIAAEIAKNAQKLLKDTRSDKEINKKLSRRVSPNTGMIDSSRSARAIGSDLPFDLHTGKPRRRFDETDEQWAARQVPLLDLSKFNLPQSSSRSERSTPPTRTVLKERTKKGAGIAGRLLGSERAQKLLQRMGMSEDDAEATQFIGELATGFSVGGPGGLAAIFGRRV
jgi:hypothetical protein